ncbi:DUF6783 domain-containing protein, partial [Robinsoniella sp.]
PTKCDVQLSESNFKTRSNIYLIKEKKNGINNSKYGKY